MSLRSISTRLLRIAALAAIVAGSLASPLAAAPSGSSAARQVSLANQGFLVMSGQTKPPGAALEGGTSRLDLAEQRFIKLGRSLEGSICRC